MGYRSSEKVAVGIMRNCCQRGFGIERSFAEQAGGDGSRGRFIQWTCIGAIVEQVLTKIL